ncbi:MAG TPA: isoleucine--tRNA ligase [Candidatus Paceibacterota bacterium]|nr:isoleucine--tRNA ligase [Candidatus Paceibacterota bacterium]
MNIPEIEKKILEFWKENKIFEKSLAKPLDKAQGNDFVFYEGPPTANGKPGIHHVLARVFKDLIPRYKTMQGYYVGRKAGWDTHGLPVELEVEKLLGLKNKKDIENYGIEKFNQKCKESAWKYKEEWERMTERIGYWVDMEHPYITYENNYIESLWWIIKQIHERKLLYKGYKVVPQCPRCGTALSSHEVAQGYQNIEEESVYVKFKVKGKDDEYILAWTTTPWTLPGNIALAVGKEIKYAKISQGNEIYYLAKDLLNKIDGKYKIIGEIKGEKLVGIEYEPLFNSVIKDNEKNAQNAFKIYPADFVSTEDGTGIVHTAVMYGQDDYELGEKIGLPKVHTVNIDGIFNELVPQWKGKFVKDVEKEIVEDLRKRNILYKTEKYKHDYPFCWRCDSPLIYYARDSWYFEMSKLRDDLIKNNERINWIPGHIKEGRFGEWLREIKDWAISRERYWGTPIPVWVCEKCRKIRVIGSRKELGVDEKFDLHRPYIDEIKLKCDCGGEMKRTPEVMDCWFDSGSMPFAQFHYPFENKNLIDKDERYPADFICEAIDQTRGWFYTLLAISTLLDKGTPYKNVICLGHILDKNGQKMSKHIGNIIDPWEMIEKYGADVVRWHFYTINQPGETKRFDEQALKESSKMFNTLLNVLTFYKMFSSDKIKDLTKKDIENVLDKWIISKLNFLINEITEHLDKYSITIAARHIEEFINDLSVWYIRRSRDRFKDGDKNAMKVLGFTLINLTKLIAPFIPFTAEHIYKELSGEKESVHLEDWPKVEKKLIDEKLEEKIKQVREICSLALQKRAEVGIKIRQPLNKLQIPNYKLQDELIDLIKDEVNIKEVATDLKEGVILDTTITKELKEEGFVRDFVRSIQVLRKEVGLTPKDRIRVYYGLSSVALAKEGKEIISKYTEQIKKQVIAEKIEFKEGADLTIDKIS